MIPNLAFAFLAGVLTILAPCSLPVIPVVLGGAVGPGRGRVLGILVGFGATFLIVTVLVASTLATLGLTTGFLRTVAAIVVGLAGAVLVFPVLERVADRIVPVATAPGWTLPDVPGVVDTPTGGVRSRPDGLVRGLMIGGALGVLWAPCVGPLMAAVIATATLQGPTLDGLLVAIAYVAGASVPLILIAAAGRGAVRRIDARRVAWLRRGLGVAMVVVSVVVLAGVDTVVAARLSALGPGDAAAAATAGAAPRPALPPFEDFGPAPELAGITAWINTDPVTLAKLRGKVVLVHFWTFACVNCQHVQPYVKAWYERYRADGLVVLSVHTPELSFERDIANVRAAVQSAGVHYPVAFDPDFATWRAYGNGAWPAFYFIDRHGHIRYRKGGEGGYDTSEAVIRALLAEPA